MTWANLSQENKMIWYLKEKKIIEYDLETVVKLTELKLFCENELKKCNSLFLSGAWKEDAFHLQVRKLCIAADVNNFRISAAFVGEEGIIQIIQVNLLKNASHHFIDKIWWKIGGNLLAFYWANIKNKS